MSLDGRAEDAREPSGALVFCALHAAPSPLLHSLDHPRFQALSKLTQPVPCFQKVLPPPFYHTGHPSACTSAPLPSPAWRGPMDADFSPLHQ